MSYEILEKMDNVSETMSDKMSEYMSGKMTHKHK